ncbi:MAG: hypothetical protein ABJD07_04015 [Gemmatimonadaceae bacterium]
MALRLAVAAFTRGAKRSAAGALCASMLGACAGVHHMNDAVRNTVERTLSPKSIQYSIALTDVERTTTGTRSYGPTSIAMLPVETSSDGRRYLAPAVYSEANGEIAHAGSEGLASQASPSTVEPRASTSTTPYMFEDSVLLVAIYPTMNALHFTLANKTARAMKIVWEDAMFVDPDGRSGRLTHAGAGRDFGDRGMSQPPTIVLRGAIVSDAVVPSNNVQLVLIGEERQARLTPLLPTPDASQAELPSVIARLHKDYVGRSLAMLLPLEVEGVRSDYLFTFTVTDVTARAPHR